MPTLHSSPVHFIPPITIGSTGQVLTCIDNLGTTNWSSLIDGSFVFQNLQFVAKGGSDSNDGFTLDTPKLTISAALSNVLSGGLVWVLDSGIYVESYSIPDNISVYAPTATLTGSIGIIQRAALQTHNLLNSTLNIPVSAVFYVNVNIQTGTVVNITPGAQVLGNIQNNVYGDKDFIDNVLVSGNLSSAGNFSAAGYNYPLPGIAPANYVMTTDGANNLSLQAASMSNLTGVITSVGSVTSTGSQTGTGSTFVMNTNPILVTPNLGTPSAGVLTNCTGTATGLTAGTVTTNANLTGPITSIGNATAIASQTGTGSTFVMETSPTLITPALGVATASSVNKVAITAPATSATLTIADGKTLTQSNSLTYSGTDGSSVQFGTGGTVAYVNGVFKTIVTQVFTSSGTYTPTAGMQYCIIEVLGAGGGGGGVTGVAVQSGCAAGGGAGGYSRKSFNAATIGASKAVSIGALGAGGAAGNNPGSVGGTTSVGVLISATGGAGGLGGAASGVSAFSGSGGPGGVGSLGDFNVAGGSGGRGNKLLGTSAISGPGGDSAFGGGGISVTGPSLGAVAGNYGSGGSGAVSIGAGNLAGGNGSPGVVIVTEYI